MGLNNGASGPINCSMMTYGLTAARRRLECGDRRERGAALVEFALVSIVLLVIVLGLIEGGLMVRASNGLENAVDDAARRGSIAGADSSADYEILQQLKRRGITRVSRINRVVIYRADVSTALPNPTCMGGIAVSGECNVYDRADLDLPQAAFGCTNSDLDSNWCPINRGPSTGEFSYLGVYIDATHEAVVGAIDVSMTASSTVALETSGEE